ncbi:alpha/beta hydrolase [Deinococcus cavernae]|uniref:Alpha/beta hydrolase n=1 Tax=Deinococcus cavernae TaxID=2320857 RepID=A0A418VAD5_9DEIO|nr:alpha/beta fold hydrolase [Deinococcus cavernae]RJF73060.1 alpha/beta hydrolase [Deinococcus cavernae]
MRSLFPRLQARLTRFPNVRRPAQVRWRPALFVLLGLVLGWAATLAAQWVQRPPLVLGQEAVSTPASLAARVTLQQDGGHFINILPASGEAKTLLIFYPGGRVRPQAYEWLGRALAQDGVQTVIPVFPLDLAVLGVNRADHLIDRYGKRRRVFVGGHSLGGAMAAQYAARRSLRLDGLILEAAYPPRNTSLRHTNLKVLSLLAERDGVARPADVRDGLKRLPPTTTLTTLPGAVHSFFGRYGPQQGDGLPAVSRAQAEASILQAVRAFLKESAAAQSTP